MNRREADEDGRGARLTLLVGSGVLLRQRRRANRCKVLIFGGTGFIGPHFVRVLRDARTQADAVQSRQAQSRAVPRHRNADRRSQRPDRRAQGPRLGRRDRRLRLLSRAGQADRRAAEGHVSRTTSIVSSISAYADLTPPGIDEDYRLAPLTDPDAKQITEENYGGLKAAVRADRRADVRQAPGGDSPLVHRRPGRHTDRFTYWPVRAARGGEMLAPGTPRDPIQFIDVRDLAEFMRLCVEQRIAGRYNLCNPPGAVTIGECSKPANGSPTPTRHSSGRTRRFSKEQVARKRRDSDLVAARQANTPALRW